MKKKTLTRRDFLNAAAMTSLAGLVSWLDHSISAKHQSSTDTPNVLLLLFDALSARNSSLYGYPRETMPNLTKFAERSTVYHQHHSAGNFTSSATASLLTGTVPWTHRSLHLFGQARDEFADKNIFSALPPEVTTFGYTQNIMVEMLFAQMEAEMDLHPKMVENGLYDERLITNHRDYLVSYWGEKITRGEHASVRPAMYLGALADWIQEAVYRQKESAYTEATGVPVLTNYEGLSFTLQDTLGWLKGLLPELPAPYFAYAHLFPPHDPYIPTEEYQDYFNDGWTPPAKPNHIFRMDETPEKIETTRREYDQFIAYTDHLLGQFLVEAEESGLLENTTVIITSDHGELFERGIAGHLTEVLYEPLLHIPLVVHHPGQTKREDIHTPTSIIDLLPTLCHMSGAPVPDWAEGEILPGFSDTPPDQNRRIFSLEAKTNPKYQPLRRGTASMIEWPYKLVYYFGYEKLAEGWEMYDLEADPEEVHDLIDQMPEIANWMKETLLVKIEEANQPYRRSE